MKQSMFSLVSALLLAAPLAGTAQQLKPNELPTNIPGATTIAAPVEWFNPLNATDQELEYYGYPPATGSIRTSEGICNLAKGHDSVKETRRSGARSYRELRRSGEGKGRFGRTVQR